MAQIITEYLKALETTHYAKVEAISKGGETYHAEETCREAISKAGREAIEKAKKLFGVTDDSVARRIFEEIERNFTIYTMPDYTPITSKPPKEQWQSLKDKFLGLKKADIPERMA